MMHSTSVSRQPTAHRFTAPSSLRTAPGWPAKEGSSASNSSRTKASLRPGAPRSHASRAPHSSASPAPPPPLLSLWAARTRGRRPLCRKDALAAEWWCGEEEEGEDRMLLLLVWWLWWEVWGGWCGEVWGGLLELLLELAGELVLLLLLLLLLVLLLLLPLLLGVY